MARVWRLTCRLYCRENALPRGQELENFDLGVWQGKQRTQRKHKLQTCQLMPWEESEKMVRGDIEPLQLTGNQLVPLMMTISRCELSRYNELCSRYAELECLWISRGRWPADGEICALSKRSGERLELERSLQRRPSGVLRMEEPKASRRQEFKIS